MKNNKVAWYQHVCLGKNNTVAWCLGMRSTVLLFCDGGLEASSRWEKTYSDRFTKKKAKIGDGSKICKHEDIYWRPYKQMEGI